MVRGWQDTKAWRMVISPEGPACVARTNISQRERGVDPALPPASSLPRPASARPAPCAPSPAATHLPCPSTRGMSPSQESHHVTSHYNHIWGTTIRARGEHCVGSEGCNTCIPSLGEIGGCPPHQQRLEAQVHQVTTQKETRNPRRIWS